MRPGISRNVSCAAGILHTIQLFFLVWRLFIHCWFVATQALWYQVCWLQCGALSRGPGAPGSKQSLPCSLFPLLPLQEDTEHRRAAVLGAGKIWRGDETWTTCCTSKKWLFQFHCLSVIYAWLCLEVVPQWIETQVHTLFGANLSKPHTSMSALSMCVCVYLSMYACLDQPLTVNFTFKVLIFHDVHADVYFS